MKTRQKHGASMAQRYKFDLALAELRKAGWLVWLEPVLRIVDDSWVLRRADDRLDHLFICESDLSWSRKRFTREPFGDYTVPYQDKGSGKGIETLIQAP